MDRKQAILIMAHNNEKILKLLIKKLDSIFFDLFIHIDEKSYIKIEDLTGLTSKSKLFVYKEISVKWGDYSQVECEFFLIDKALSLGNYEYYHLLSGADFPLKDNSFIYNFFHNHYGKEFIHYQSLILPDNKRRWIVNETDFKLMTGANWFSITDKLAKYILTKRLVSKEIFYGSRSPDEFFLQTFVLDSPFRLMLYNQNYNDDYDSIKRYIDWHRGIPYVWTIDDYEELINSKYLFARKFDQNKDLEVVQRLYDNI